MNVRRERVQDAHLTAFLFSRVKSVSFRYTQTKNVMEHWSDARAAHFGVLFHPNNAFVVKMQLSICFAVAVATATVTAALAVANFVWLDFDCSAMKFW